MDDFNAHTEENIQQLFVDLDNFIEKIEAEGISNDEQSRANSIIELIKTQVSQKDRRHQFRSAKLLQKIIHRQKVYSNAATENQIFPKKRLAKIRRNRTPRFDLPLFRGHRSLF